MLEDILKVKKCFKLVCGAGNEDTQEVEKLVYLYSKAGCNFFDLSANIEAIQAAKKGLKEAGIKQDRYICVSVGIKGDMHISKAEINNDLCKKCDMCKKICPQSAITENLLTKYVKSKKCIGCGKCFKVCKHNAVKINYFEQNLENILPEIIKEGIDCIELHIHTENEEEVIKKWETINSLYSGMLSLCVDRLALGDEQLIRRLKLLLQDRKPYTTIIQADGNPMSGGEDDYKTTLQAVATGDIIQNANLPVYILLSGGTNSKTSELASICKVNINGVSIGSYARKIVKDYIKREDFFTNAEVFNSALNIAKNLVDSSFKYL